MLPSYRWNYLSGITLVGPFIHRRIYTGKGTRLFSIADSTWLTESFFCPTQEEIFGPGLTAVTQGGDVDGVHSQSRECELGFVGQERFFGLKGAC